MMCWEAFREKKQGIFVGNAQKSSLFFPPRNVWSRWEDAPTAVLKSKYSRTNKAFVCVKSVRVAWSEKGSSR